jgi:hypothetical protein
MSKKLTTAQKRAFEALPITYYWLGNDAWTHPRGFFRETLDALVDCGFARRIKRDHAITYERAQQNQGG